MSLLSPNDYNAIRAAIDLTIDEEVLPDDIIELPTFMGVAEEFVLVRDPLAATRTGTERKRIKNAVIYLTASLILPAVPFYVRESFGDYSYTRTEADTKALSARLRQLADAELNTVLGIVGTVAVPTMFDVATGRRGA
jgi:hypothetical protein